MNHIKNIWKCFEEKHFAIAKWLYQIFYFVIFSMGVTVFQYLVFYLHFYQGFWELVWLVQNLCGQRFP